MHELIRNLLQQSLPDGPYRRELLRIISRWGEASPVAQALATLPTLVAQALVGDPICAVPVTAAWQLVRLAAKLFDDVEDGDCDSPAPLAINIATGLLFSAQLALGELPPRLSTDLVHRIGQEMQRAMLRAGAGQHADLLWTGDIETTPDPEAWLEIASAKSGKLLGWSTWAGACAAGADEADQACFREYGSHLGVLLQVSDDHKGVWQSTGPSDLASRHLSLAVCYGRFVAKGSSRRELDRLLGQATRKQQDAEAQARQLLTDLGAAGYLLAVARIYHEQAIDSLLRSSSPPTVLAPLRSLVDHVFPMLEIQGA